mgnify:CR=1 FL=1
MDSIMMLSLERWVHFLAGITWIGLLYFFNFVNAPAMAQANADKEGPGPAAIGKYIMPRALLWFRWAAVVTWVSGALYIVSAPHYSLHEVFTLAIGQGKLGVTTLGVGAWLGTIMLFNVWVLIWPNQKKVLGMVTATDAEKAKARRLAFLASRANTALSIPMLLFMGAAFHNLPM